jgi:lipoprotein NlpD
MLQRILLWLLLCLVQFLVACAAQGGAYHTVERGQTLYTISRIYSVDERYLARINGISDPSRLRVGQQLFIPGADRARQVPATVRSEPLPPPAAVVKPVPAPPTGGGSRPIAGRPSPPPLAVGVPAKPAEAVPERVQGGPPPAARDRFVWPARGQLLRKFGDRQDSTKSKGVEIGLPKGTGVAAAAAGKVIYSGDGITGYGNLVIVRHDNSFFTVYAFNQENLVATGAFVSKGEKIARSGVPPKGGVPRLYFEIRHGKDPVDPIFYLP